MSDFGDMTKGFLKSCALATIIYAFIIAIIVLLVYYLITNYIC
jgi:hypothetical protein